MAKGFVLMGEVMIGRQDCISSPSGFVLIEIPQKNCFVSMIDLI